ncbi:hypothetical protein, partial [Pseudomonas aeruginosa]
FMYLSEVSEMRVRLSKKMMEAMAYLIGFSVFAVPGTYWFGSQVPITDWKLAALIFLEFAGAEAMRSGLLILLARGHHDECN